MPSSALKSVVLDDGYVLYNTGRIVNKKGRAMKNETFSRHTVKVRLRSPGKKQRHLCLAQLVLTHFDRPRPFPEAQARHKDGNPFNNHIDNLEWGTAKQNSDDKKRHGTHPSDLRGKKKA